MMSGCEGYEAIARVYDKLNAEIDYAAWADFFEAVLIAIFPTAPNLFWTLPAARAE